MIFTLRGYENVSLQKIREKVNIFNMQLNQDPMILNSVYYILAGGSLFKANKIY
jgi:hypothetical protein